MFYVNVALAGIDIVAAFLVIPRDPKRHVRRSFDLPGALTVTAGATLLVFALVQGPEYGWGSSGIIWSFVLAAAGIVLSNIVALVARQKQPKADCL